jgi:hypothetical protein
MPLYPLPQGEGTPGTVCEHDGLSHFERVTLMLTVRSPSTSC